jgi:hypothetical protein
VSWRGARNKNRPSCPMACLLALGPFIATRVVDLTPFHAAAEVVDRRFADALSTSVSVRFNEAAGALQQWAVKASATDENGGEDEAFLAVVGLAVEVSALEINGIVRRELATPEETAPVRDAAMAIVPWTLDHLRRAAAGSDTLGSSTTAPTSGAHILGKVQQCNEWAALGNAEHATRAAEDATAAAKRVQELLHDLAVTMISMLPAAGGRSECCADARAYFGRTLCGGRYQPKCFTTVTVAGNGARSASAVIRTDRVSARKIRRARGVAAGLGFHHPCCPSRDALASRGHALERNGSQQHSVCRCALGPCR